MKFKSALAIAASALFLTSVHAQDFKPGFYAGADLGYSPIHDLSGSPASEISSFAGGAVDISRDKGAFSGRVFGGYKVLENIDIELGYFQSASYSENFHGEADGGMSYSGNASQKVSGLDYSVLLRPSISTGFNGAFLRLGGHYSRAKHHMSVTSDGVTGAASGSGSGAGVMAGIGYDYAIAKNVDLRGEYNHMESVGGRSDTPMNTFRIGVVGKF